MLKIPFNTIASGIDESNINNLSPKELSKDLANRKIAKTLKDLEDRYAPWIFSADTLVALDNEIIGKSSDRNEAKKVLQKLSGREHDVWTACALYNGKTKQIDCRVEKCQVVFDTLSESCLNWYLDSCEWQEAAGSYKIQGIASCFIKKIKGSYSTVVGLPLHLFYNMLIENGYKFDFGF
jgi:septum formation protein